ncbi:MAG: LytTR family DNA-binding domain-containing protein [Gordonibacter sp.]|nr:LytTR family DNA-binding domain-containing protein [Gordonibacter sp.]
MQIALCDDNQTEREALAALLKKLRPTAHLVQYENGQSLIDAHRSGRRFDLAFLDIYLEDMNGIDAAAALRSNDERLAIVFSTVSRDFAVESYDVAAMAYLMKPVSIEPLSATLDRFDATWKPRSIFIRDRFFIMDDIVCAESRNKHVTFTFRDGATAEITAKLSEVEDQLYGGNFLRCHRSFIVNMDHVDHIGDKCFIMATGDVVLIRQKQYASMKKSYYDYITAR